MALFTPPNPEPPHELVQAGYRYALALTHHHHDAEDLVQQSWLNLHRRHGSAPDRFTLFRSIRNLFLDGYRRGKIVVFEPLSEADEGPAPLSDPGEPGRLLDLDTLLATLRAEEREILFLHYVEGQTAEEIGQLTGKPRGTVLSMIWRAKSKLQRSLNRETATEQPGAGCDE